MRKKKIRKKPGGKKNTRKSTFYQKLAGFLKRRETVIIAVIFVTAVFFRMYNVTDLGLTHFDEGVYALYGERLVESPGTFYEDTLRIAQFSPPLYPFCCGVSFTVLGVKDFAAIVPSIIAGALTCLVLFLLGKSTDDLRTGMWAAVILIVNPFHVMYSRLALTDVLYVFFFTAAVLAGIYAWKKNRWWLYMLPGFLAGLAMNTKYSGFLPLALVFGYFIFAAILEIVERLIKHEQEGESWKSVFINRMKHLLPGMTASVILFVLLYAHWYINVDKKMGYDNLLEHHRGYGKSAAEAFAAFKNNPWEMLFYFRQWSFPALILLPLGLIASIWKWKRSYIILYAWLAFYYIGLFFYERYTRLALPLIPAICFFGGIFLSRAFLLLESKWKDGGKLLPKVEYITAALVVVMGFIRLFPVLSMDTDHYRKANRSIRENYADKGVVIRDTLEIGRAHV